MSPHCTSDQDRLTRLEELTFFQEERLKELPSRSSWTNWKWTLQTPRL